MAYRLDVNALVALFDEAHIHHLAAHDWFERMNDDWTTCPITENGLLRILSHLAYPNSPLPMVNLAERLEEFKSSSKKHQFWSDDYSLSEWLYKQRHAISSGQSTDAYLLNLCKKRSGTLATFDRRIKPSLIGETFSHILEYITA